MCCARVGVEMVSRRERLDRGLREARDLLLLAEDAAEPAHVDEAGGGMAGHRPDIVADIDGAAVGIDIDQVEDDGGMGDREVEQGGAMDVFRSRVTGRAC